MATAKDIVIKPITSKASNNLVRKIHYSGKVVPNSQLHFGVFLDGKLEGAMQFGPSMDKRKTINIVKGTLWNGFLELNRMAFSEKLPKNSESRAISISMRLIKKHYPHIEWILSFADGTQCGDGTIYRASGFVLTQIKKNNTIIKLKDGTIAANMTFSKGKHILNGGGAKAPEGSVPLKGYQFRYIYFLNEDAKRRLTVPVIPFGKIDEIGAGMYKGQKRVKEQESENPSDLGGATPTHTLHT
jgi:hypothetical protein